MAVLMAPLSRTTTTLGTAESYPVFINLKLECPWMWMGVSETAQVSVKWDPNKTRVRSARISYVADTDALFLIVYRIYMNENKVVWRDMGEFAPKHVENGQDVTSLLYNGVNIFRVEANKKTLLPYGYTVVTSVYLIVEFEGESPSVSPPSKPIPLDEYIKVAVMGALIGGGGFVAYNMLTEPTATREKLVRSGVAGALAGAFLGAGLKYLLSMA